MKRHLKRTLSLVLTFALLTGILPAAISPAVALESEAPNRMILLEPTYTRQRMSHIFMDSLYRNGEIMSRPDVAANFFFGGSGDASAELMRVSYNGYSGLADPTGRVVYPLIYDDIELLYENWYRVIKDGETEYINTSGEIGSPTATDHVGWFSDGLAPVQVGEKWGYINTSGSIVVPATYDAVGGFSEGFGSVQKDGKWGFVNTSGTLTIPLLYDDAGWFSEGLAHVQNNGKWGYINTSGTAVIQINLDYKRVEGFYNDLAVVHNKDDKVGVINKLGAPVVPTIYDAAWIDDDGLIRALADDWDACKWVYLTPSGEHLVPIIYDEAWINGNGLIRVRIGSTETGRFGYFNMSGDVIVDPMGYDFAQADDNGLIRVRIGDKWGLLNISGTEVLPTEYDVIGDFNEGLAPIKKNGKWGFINGPGIMNENDIIGSGTIMVPIEYDAVGWFSEGLAAVGKNGNWGYADRYGEVIIPISSDYDEAGAFLNGFAKVQKNGKWGVVNRGGIVVVSAIYDEVCINGNGLIRVRTGSKWGIVNTWGNLVLPIEYDTVEMFDDGFAKIQKNGKWGLVYENGKVVLTPTYDDISSFVNGYAWLVNSEGGETLYGIVQLTYYEDILYGDVDGDGVIDAADVTLLRRYIAAENKDMFLIENPRFNRDNADVNGDGFIGPDDVALLRMYIAGFDVVLGPLGGGITTHSISIPQAAAPNFWVFPVIWNQTAVANSMYVVVTSDVLWSTPTSSNTSWLTISNVDIRVPEGGFRMNVTANTGASRTATVTVRGVGVTDRTITVNQAGSASAPSAITNLSATAGNSQVTLSWSAPSNGGAAISRYEFRQRTGTGAWGAWTSTGSTTTSRIVTSLTNGTSYGFQVRAVNSAGNGGDSNTATATPAAPATVPSAPQSFVATPGNGQVILTWSAPSSNGGSSITRYEVSSNGGSSWVTASSNTSHTFTSLSNGTSYSFRVRAVNAAGAGTAASTTATPRTTPSAPQGLTATPGNGQVALTWSAPLSNGGSPITSYQVSRDGGSTWVTPTSNTSHTFTGLINGQSYTFNVRAINAAGNGLQASVTSAPVAPATYSIGYNSNGGSPTPAAQIKTQNVNLTLSNIRPARGGYNFLFWSSSHNGAQYQPGNIYTPNANSTLTAQWSPVVYTVTYDANVPFGVTVTNMPAEQRKPHDSNLILRSTIPVRAGYTFLGWSENRSAATATYSAASIYTVNANVRLYAVWADYSLTVSPTSWNPLSSASTNTFSVRTAGSWQLFGGASWLTASRIGGTGDGSFTLNATANTGSSARTAAMTVVATQNGQFRQQTITVTQASQSRVTIEWDARPGTVNPRTQDLIPNDFFGVLPIPEREGYLFLGWFHPISGRQIIGTNTFAASGIQSFEESEVAFEYLGIQPVSSNASRVPGTSITLNARWTEFRVSPPAFTAWRTGDERIVEVTVSREVLWTIQVPPVNWLSVSRTSGSGNGRFTITVGAYTGRTQRTAPITITASLSGQIITGYIDVWQRAPMPTVYAVATDQYGALTSTERESNARYIFRYLHERGWSTQAIAAVLGNVQHEGQFNPGQWENAPNSWGYGILQWTGWEKIQRMTGLDRRTEKDKIDAMANTPVLPMTIQLNFLISSSRDGTEWNNNQRAVDRYHSPYRSTFADFIISTDTPERLALVFHAHYLRSGDNATVVQQRSTLARNWHTKIMNEWI
jgi:uncharacterized repeat protein (TIGR02543 family)